LKPRPFKAKSEAEFKAKSEARFKAKSAAEFQAKSEGEFQANQKPRLSRQNQAEFFRCEALMPRRPGIALRAGS